jgi:HSP20 family protein
MYSSNRQGSRSWLGDVFGFDPMSLMRSPEAFGLAIERTDEGYRIEVPVAGFRPEEINITVEDRQLLVEGRNERRRFTRAIVLPEEIDAERIDARVDNGLLTLMLPLNQKMQPRRIAVRVGSQQQGLSDSTQGQITPSSTTQGTQSGSTQGETTQAGTSGTVPTVSGERQEERPREMAQQTR